MPLLTTANTMLLPTENAVMAGLLPTADSKYTPPLPRQTRHPVALPIAAMLQISPNRCRATVSDLISCYGSRQTITIGQYFVSDENRAC